MRDIRRLCSEYLDNELPEDVQSGLEQLAHKDSAVHRNLECMRHVQTHLDAVPVPDVESSASRVWGYLCSSLPGSKRTFSFLYPIPILASLFIVLFFLPFLTDNLATVATAWQEQDPVVKTNNNIILGDVVASKDMIIQNDFETLIELLMNELPEDSNIVILPSQQQFNIEGEPLLVPISISSGTPSTETE